jgi:hypothetical protein
MRLFQIAAISLFALLLASCAPAEEPLPTLAPTLTPSIEPPTASPTSTSSPTAAPTATPTVEPSATATSTASPTATATFTPSPTFTPSATFTATVNPTVQAAASATAAQIQRPIFATFTPAPPGVPARPTSTGTPQVVADVVITEAQFQQELNRLLAGKREVDFVEIDFAPDGVRVTLSALAGQAIASGEFTVYFSMSQPGFNNLLTVYADSPEAFRMVGGLPPNEAFINVAYLEVVPAVFAAFDNILNERLGRGRHNLDNLVLTDREMLVTLLTTAP